MSKPREWWMAKNGNGYYDGESEVPQRQPELYIHVIEYSAYNQAIYELDKARKDRDNALALVNIAAEREHRVYLSLITEIAEARAELEKHLLVPLSSGETLKCLKDAGIDVDVVMLLETERARSAKLVEALKFYANKKSWIPEHHELSGLNGESDIDFDNGNKARAAIAEYEKGSK